MGDLPKLSIGRFLIGSRKKKRETPQERYSEEDSFVSEVPVGRMTYGARNFSKASWKGLQSVGRYCSIAKDCSVAGHSHPMEWVTTHPILYNPSRGFILKKVAHPANVTSRNKKVVIGSDVWIGEGVRILRSVTLGHGCVVGAGSVVTKSVPPYAIVAGVPAKIIRYRIPEHLISSMLEIAWWDWPIEAIKSRIESFYDPAEFVRKFSSARSAAGQAAPEEAIQAIPRA